MDKQNEVFKGTTVPWYCPPGFMALTVRGDCEPLVLIDARQMSCVVEHEGAAVVMLQGNSEGLFVRESVQQVMSALTEATR